MKLVQIVITRKDDNTFKVSTFTEQECADSRLMNEDETNEFVSNTMKRLKQCNHLE